MIRIVHHLSIIGIAQLIFMQVTYSSAQDSQKDEAKKNPIIQPLGISEVKQDSGDTKTELYKRQLPRFDLPEYVITGVATVDLPKLEKINFERNKDTTGAVLESFRKSKRGRETATIEMKDRFDDSQTISKKYSGILKACIGSYFTPELGLWFGQTLPDFSYSLGGTYHLTKGYTQHTDQSGGGFDLRGGKSLSSDKPFLNNASLAGRIEYQAESFHFYGSGFPDLQRTISDLVLQLGIKNKTTEDFPYSANASIGNFNVTDSSVSKIETRINLNMQTTLLVASLPLRIGFHLMSATGGLNLLDVSGGIGNYDFAGVIIEGYLHLYAVKGMEGQNLVRLRPHITASFQATNQHRIYLSYKPVFNPKTLSSSIGLNRFLSTSSVVKHENVTDAGEIGIESDWGKAIQSHLSVNIQSIRDLMLFTDSSSQGVWETAYGDRTTIITFCGEMVAKLMSNDYFACNVMLRSTKDTYRNNIIPYVPNVEGNCYLYHVFGSVAAASMNVRYVGERKADLFEAVSLPGYVVIDVSGEYAPFDFLRFTAGAKNLTGTRYEKWRGYQEFPMTIFISAQFKW